MLNVRDGHLAYGSFAVYNSFKKKLFLSLEFELLYLKKKQWNKIKFFKNKILFIPSLKVDNFLKGIYILKKNFMQDDHPYSTCAYINIRIDT